MNTNAEVMHDDIESFGIVIDNTQAPEPNAGTPAAGDKRDWLKKLPGLLRGFGALAVLFSLYNFFARGWDGSSDLIRYLMLLGHTGALAAVGLASGHYLKEGKGARLLLILALVSVVANFAILGAFIFSSVFADQLGVYPHYLAWSLGSPLTALLVTLGSLVVLLPVVRIGFLTLARGVSMRMTVLFLMGNAALLLPMRTPMMVTLLTLAMAVMLLLWCGKSLRQSTAVKTREGMAALAMQFLPIIVLLGRNLWLYSPGTLLYTVAVFTTYIAVRQLALFLDQQSALRSLSETVSLVLTALTGLGIHATLNANAMGGSLALLGATLGIAAMTYDISLRAADQGPRYRSATIGIVVSGMGLNLIIYGGILTSLVTIAIGLGLITTSYIIQQRTAFIGGVTLFLGGMLEQFLHLFQLFNLGYWATLAIIGVAAILIGSLLESRGGNLKSRITAWRARYSEWSY